MHWLGLLGHFRILKTMFGSSTNQAGRRSSPFEVIILNVTKKSSGALNEPSRNFEFCQPQCLKCVCAFLVELDPAGLICCHFTSALPDIGKKIAKQSHKVPVFEII